MTVGLVSLHGGHSDYGDGAGRLDDFALAAANQGMLAFGFTEHMPRRKKYWYPTENPERHSFQWYQGYVRDARQVQSRFQGRIEILVGAELELIPGEEEFLGEFLSEFKLDYAVGSVHFVRDLGFDYSPEYYGRAISQCGGFEAFCLDYLETMEAMLEKVSFQVLGHFDLFKVHSTEPIMLSDKALDRIDRLMRRIAAAGRLLDINANGLSKPCREIYPSVQILRLARKHGVEVTLGDDSHSPQGVGRNLEAALEHLRHAGYAEITYLKPDGSRPKLRI
ncbi:MAG TPA: histidinol-phosphatase [Acidobacteriota bacterium]|jgi:histidinol-phosphatase (PHP family)